MYLGSIVLEVGSIVHSGFEQVLQADHSVLFTRVRYFSIHSVVSCQDWNWIDVDCISGEDHIIDRRDVSGKAMPTGHSCMLRKPIMLGCPWEIDLLTICIATRCYHRCSHGKPYCALEGEYKTGWKTVHVQEQYLQRHAAFRSALTSRDHSLITEMQLSVLPYQWPWPSTMRCNTFTWLP
jgi:hypothetical protein